MMERASVVKFYNFFLFFLESFYKTIAHKPFIHCHQYTFSLCGIGLLAIDRILEALRNGDWHEIGEITQRLQIGKSQVELISSFLATYDFLEFDHKSKRIRLSPQLQRFLRKIIEVESEETSKKKQASHTSVISFLNRSVSLTGF